MKSTERTTNPAPSTIWRRDLAERRKAALIDFLGGQCVECGSATNLHFDHKDGRDWEPREVHYTKRLRIYTEEAIEGKIQLLCGFCNSSKADACDTEIEPQMEAAGFEFDVI